MKFNNKFNRLYKEELQKHHYDQWIEIKVSIEFKEFFSKMEYQ